MLPEYQLQGELVISVPRHRHPCATITVGKGWGIWLEVYTLLRVVQNAPKPPPEVQGGRSNFGGFQKMCPYRKP